MLSFLSFLSKVTVSVIHTHFGTSHVYQSHRGNCACLTSSKLVRSVRGRT